MNDQVLRFGSEGESVVVMDDFVPDPVSLRRLASAQPFGPAGPYYPGVRAAAPAAHLTSSVDRLELALREVFGVRQGVSLVECNFSLVTTAPEELAPIQRLPHFDTVNPGRFALLHFLCDESFGGTAFYRHRATGFETLCRDRLPAYQRALAGEYAQFGPPERTYVTNGDPQFEQIGQVCAHFNRAILYRGITLHSGLVGAPAALSHDPWRGRLTVNTFFDAKQK